MERTWRWFGKKDKITLAQLRQIGVEGIVTALHDVPLGEVWTREKIRDLREYIESYGMRWSVVESLPVVETIKYGGPDRDQQIEVYKQSLRNLSAEGIHCICYNFMPVLDWARTDPQRFDQPLLQLCRVCLFRHLHPEARRRTRGVGTVPVPCRHR